MDMVSPPAITQLPTVHDLHLCGGYILLGGYRQMGGRGVTPRAVCSPTSSTVAQKQQSERPPGRAL